MNHPLIDYRKISHAQQFYSEQGFVEIAVPWILEKEAYLSTAPADRILFSTPYGYLNASGEQSFIQLMLQGTSLSKNFCITSCFRSEPVLDRLHQLYFVKLELIDTDVSFENLRKMISTAQMFLQNYVSVTCVQTGNQSFDLVDAVHGIELGSYGIRSYKHLQWIYGTGLALPRLDIIKEKNELH